MANKKLSRRNFIKIIVASGAALSIGLPALKELQLIKTTRLLMGTLVDLTLISPHPLEARQAAEECLAEMAGLESILSRFLPNSQLTMLNRTGSLNNPHQALRKLIRQSYSLSELSKGMFDITIKPLQDLYLTNTGTPDQASIQDTLTLVDYRKLILEEKRVFLADPGMSITLDGIAKGYIVDAGIQKLKEAGFKDMLVEAGGDLSASGSRAGSTPWRVGVQDPRQAIGQILTQIEIQDQSLATSGDYLQSYTPDRSNHHILDPLTGSSSPDFASVTIKANTATLADGLATAVMAMGQPGLDLIEELADCEAFAVTKGGQIFKTSGFIEG